MKTLNVHPMYQDLKITQEIELSGTLRRKRKKKKMNNKRRHKLFINNLTVIRNRVSWMIFCAFGRELPQPKELYKGFGRKQSRGHCLYDRGKTYPLLPNYGNIGLWTKFKLSKPNLDS